MQTIKLCLALVVFSVALALITSCSHKSNRMGGPGIQWKRK